jgi:hypothetical protein
MTHNINDFIGGSIGHSMAPTEVPENTASQQVVNKVVERKGLFTQIAEWFTPSKPAPSPIDSLPDDALALIVQNLSMPEWTHIALTCRRTSVIVKKLFLFQAQTWGYSGGDLEEGSKYRREIAQELASCTLYWNEVGIQLTDYIQLSKTGSKAQMATNTAILTKLDQESILYLFSMPNIYCLEKTKKFVCAAMECIPLQQWNLNNILDSEGMLARTLLLSTIYEEPQIVTFAIKLGAHLNEPISLTSLSYIFTGFKTADFFCLFQERIGKRMHTFNHYHHHGGYRNYPVSALHHAAYFNHKTEVVTLLLENGADPKLLDDSLHSPLITAINNGKYEMALTLLDHGALINQPDDASRTPFYLACWRYVHLLSGPPTMADTAFITHLLSYGADWNAVANGGSTPAHIWASQLKG